MARMRVLLAQADSTRRGLLHARLVEGRHFLEVVCVGDGDHFLRAARDRHLDCAILDADLIPRPATAALDAIRRAIAPCPLIVVSASREQQVAVECFRAGAADFIPLADALLDDTLWRRVEHAIAEARRCHGERRTQARRLARMRRLAETDHLTGLFNRRHLDLLMSGSRSRHDRRRLMSAVMIDADHFKRVNDSLGHAAGDDVIRAIATTIAHAAGPGATAVRWGGEEFVMLRHVGRESEAWRAAELLRRRVAAQRIQTRAGPLRVTVSVGVAVSPTNGLSEEIIFRADHALCMAKDRGRNRVCTWGMTLAEREADTLELARTMSVEQRRAALMRRLSLSMGPSQQEHTGTHCDRTASLACEITDRLGIRGAESERVRLAALLHDIGKCAAPDDLLARPAALDNLERSILRTVGEESARLAERLGIGAAGSMFIRRSHTQGTALARGVFPLGASIVSVADALAAMMSERPYRRARTRADAVAELRTDSSGRFDPAVLAAAERAAATAVGVAA
ncbi:MAG: diguanylate cyclase [Phycisphaeraceae bacterium]|nr:diguanylate cyclase [Phycisphaeraceae bacterium]